MPQPEPALDPLWRRRWLLLAGGVVPIATLAELAFVRHSAWNWALFGWGIGIGLALILVLESGLVLIMRRIDVPADRKAGIHRRQYIYIPGLIFGGLLFGMIAAIFDAIWVDVLGSAYAFIVLAAVVTFAVLARRSGLPMRRG